MKSIIKNLFILLFLLHLVNLKERNPFIHGKIDMQRKNFLFTAKDDSENEQNSQDYITDTKHDEENEQDSNDIIGIFLKEGKEKVITILRNSTDFKLLYLDLLLFSGDVDIIPKTSDLDFNKHYLSNKIFLSIHLENNDEIKILEFSVIAKKNSYFMCDYNFFMKGMKDINKLNSGINYITSKFIDEQTDDFSKNIQLNNSDYQARKPFLISFYSPNCKFNLLDNYKDEDYEILSENNNFFQRIMDPSDTDRYKQIYNLFYEIIPDEDNSEISRKYCMVYVSGVPISSSPDQLVNFIILSEAVPHRYTFSRSYPAIVYAYCVTNINNTLVLNFKLIDKSAFIIRIYLDDRLDEKRIYRNSQIYLRKEDFINSCESEDYCPVFVKIEMEGRGGRKTVEFTMYQIDSVPHYLEKNVIKQDILHGNMPKHYYFEISNEEHGDITLDFKRGSGFIYATVQNRTLEKPMDNSEWRGLYHFPTTMRESLRFRQYGKKIDIDPRSTRRCTEGCYVLITIVSHMNYYGENLNDSIPFRISINPRIMLTNRTFDFPIVKMEVNEFVIGEIISGPPRHRPHRPPHRRPNQIDPSDQPWPNPPQPGPDEPPPPPFPFENETRYDYYSVILPFESEYVLIDWQADYPNLIVNVGNKRPTKESYHFNFTREGHDTVYRMNKSDIIKYDNLNHSSLRGVKLTLGIYSEKNDSIHSSPYAFKLFMPPTYYDDENLGAEIIHIRADQKVQCRPFKYNNEYACMFAVVFDDIDINNALVLFPRSQEGEEITMYGQYVDSKDIERNNIGEIELIMRLTFENENLKIKDPYFYAKNIVKEKSFFFMLSEETDSIMEVLSSTQMYYKDIDIYPNPSTVQIFAIENYEVKLHFETTQDLLLNIVGVSGLGGFYWDTEEERHKKFYLNSFGDRLSLTTNIMTRDREKRLAPLKIKPDSPNTPGGFIFYITYYPRSHIDQLREGRNTEFNYRSVRLPLFYYLPIDNFTSYTINFDFYDLTLRNNEILEYDTNIFDIWATLLTEDEVLEARVEFDKIPKYDSSNCIKGNFDLNFGNLFLSKEDINRLYDIDDNPYLFFAIGRSNNTNITRNISSLSLEINVLSGGQTPGFARISEGIYITGKLLHSEKKELQYLLLCNKNTKYLRVEYAANSDYVQFVLNSEFFKRENEDFQNMKKFKRNGRNIVEINLDDKFFFPGDDYNILYLTVFTNENELNDNLDDFSFKYSTSKLSDDIDKLFKDEENATYTVNNNIYKISLTPLFFNADYATYNIKAIYKDNVIEGEKFDTIAMTESKGKSMQVNNPSYNSDQKVTFDLKVDEKISHIKVMARYNIGQEKIFFLYNVVEDKEDKEDNKKKGDNTLVYVVIGVGGFLLVTAIIIVIFIFIFKRKKKELMEDVNKISFVESQAKDKGTRKEENYENNLLINDDDASIQN